MRIRFLTARSKYMEEVVEKSVESLYSHLSAGEIVEALCVGVFQDNYGVCALTNSRLIFFSDKGYNTIYKDFSYEFVNTIRVADKGLYNIKFSFGDAHFRLGFECELASQFGLAFQELKDLFLDVYQKAS